MSIRYDEIKGEKIEKIELPQFDDNSMYDVNELMSNFELLGTGMTFQQTLDFFRQASLLPRESIEDYVKANPEKVYAGYLRSLMPYMEKSWADVLPKETWDYILEHPGTNYEELLGSEYEKFKQATQMSEEEKIAKADKKMLRFKSLPRENQIEEVEEIYSEENRNADYRYFSIYTSRLKDKGLTYLALLQFIANNSQVQQGNPHWESLLTELDINYDGASMLGSDVRRVLSALFNSQSALANKLAIANDLSTYHSEYLMTDMSRQEAKYGENNPRYNFMYPSAYILRSLELDTKDPIKEKLGLGTQDSIMRNLELYDDTHDVERPDDTSIAMSERQLKEELGIRKSLRKKIAPKS